MLTIITVVGVKHQLPSNIAWSEMCQTNKEIGGHITKLVGKWPVGGCYFHPCKTEHFSYKGGCGVCERMHIKAFKRRTGLGYILMALSY